MFLLPRSRRVYHARRVSYLGLAVAVLLLGGQALAQSGATTRPGAASPPSPTASSNNGAKMNELQKIDVKQGDGAEAVRGKAVLVHYTGWLYDATAPDHHGKKFDSSVDRGQPFGFILGAGKVIRGWDEGVAGMKVGGKRTLIIPPAMGYGEHGAGGVIPPNATLVFDVELVDIRS